MLNLLADNPVLTLFLVVGVGALIGLIPFGPIRFGPAGALFAGLALGALDDRLGEGLDLVRIVGLVLFVYTVGLASGATLIRTFRRQAPIMLASAVVLALIAAATIVLGGLLGVGAAHLGGAYAGVGTSTATLAAATQAAGTEEPAVGYALTYPLGVLLGIVAVNLALTGRRKTDEAHSAAVAGLVDLTIVVGRRARLIDVPGVAQGAVRFSFWTHGQSVGIAGDEDVVEPGDRIVVVGSEEAIDTAVAWLGARADEHLAHDRRDVDYRRVLVSNRELAGHTIAELAFPQRFGGVVTRIRRGDLDLLARDDVHVQLGDRLRVVVPRGRMPEASAYLGDTERRVSEVDAVSLGLGLALGFLVGLIPLPVGPVTLSLGLAAGPLVVGIVLGWLERTGPIVWTLPTGAGLTLRQIGLLLFLAAVGLSTGPALAASVTEPIGWKLALLGAALAAAGPALIGLVAGRLGNGPARSGGLIAGFVGNPSLLAFANNKSLDERINEGFATLFALDQILKVLLVQVIVAVA